MSEHDGYLIFLERIAASSKVHKIPEDKRASDYKPINSNYMNYFFWIHRVLKRNSVLATIFLFDTTFHKKVNVCSFKLNVETITGIYCERGY